MTNNPKPGDKKELPVEARLLIAFLLMGVVLLITPYFQPPQPAPPAEPPKPAPAKTVAPPEATDARPAVTTPPQDARADKEERITIDTDFHRVRFTNRGAVVTSWVLKKYKDSAGKQLDVLNHSAVPQTGAPFALHFRERKPSTDLNDVFFQVKLAADKLGVVFEYSDGRIYARKAFRFTRDRYLLQLSSEVSEAGSWIPHLLAWRGGFGDMVAFNAAQLQQTVHFDVAKNELVLLEASKAESGPLVNLGNYSFAGLQDPYFAAVVLPPTGEPLELRTIRDLIRPAGGGEAVPYVGMAVGGGGRMDLRLFVGPKDTDLLRRLDPKLEQLVDYGWFWWIAKPLFLSMRWLDERYIHNYGWTIIVITVVINFLLLPLKMSSMKSMKKMQTLQPQVKAIQEKYGTLPLRDPRRNEMNQKVMELYQKHGVNPMGGCVPLLLPFPFFFAFYKVLSVAIELRGAQWLWVTDLSQPETIAIRVLPLAMIATQFILQKMTPSAGADPAQQRVMLIMPLMFGFLFYNASSGLVLYWLTTNLVGILQQWMFNRSSSGTVTVAAPAPVRKKGARN